MTGEAPEKVLPAAFTGNNNKVVIVALNESDAAVSLPIAITGGALTAQLEKMSVTTFVSK